MAAKQPRNRGKGRPFPKGKSGNPKGRPPLGDAAAEWVRSVLSEKGSDGVVNGTAILRKMVTRAKGGDVKAATFLFDRGYGKAMQPVGGEDGGPITIRVVRE